MTDKMTIDALIAEIGDRKSEWGEIDPNLAAAFNNGIDTALDLIRDNRAALEAGMARPLYCDDLVGDIISWADNHQYEINAPDQSAFMSAKKSLIDIIKTACENDGLTAVFEDKEDTTDEPA